MAIIAAMSDLKLNAQEDKDVESVSDSPGRTREPLQPHTFSPKNNAAGLSSDEHENPLNGTQPNPFVYSSVPAVPHAGNSLPSGALVNGPGSHPNSEVHCVLNKGTVLSNSVLDAVWQAEKDTSPEVLPPPSELQSDAWKNTVGPDVKTPATQPGVNTPLSHSEENESKLAYSTLSGDSAEQMHISQPLTKQTIKTRSPRDMERSGVSLDDYDNTEVIRWDSTRKCFLHNDRRLETKVMPQRDKKHNTHTKSMLGCLEKVNNSYRHFCSGNDVESVDTGNKDEFLGTQSDIKYSVMPFKDLSRNIALDSESHIYSTAQGGSNEENDPEDENCVSPKVEQLKAEQLERDSLFFSCTTCNVNFKEKRHFHRHMMYHLGKHNQVNSENDSQPFICGECGLLFCDSNSLMRHIIIHQDRLEKLMEEIEGLKKTEFEDGATTVPCSRCTFGCNCQKVFVQGTKTHDNLKHYYFCEECNYISLTRQTLVAHLHVAHLNTHQPQNRKMSHTNDAEGAQHVPFQCKMSFFPRRDKVVLGKHSEMPYVGKYKTMARCKPNLFKSTLKEKLDRSTEKGDIHIQKTIDNTVNCHQFKPNASCTKTKHQSPHALKVEDDGDEDCSDIEQLIIKEEHIETTVSDDSTELPNTSPSDSFDMSPTPSVKHKPCPYCPATFESGVGLSNHVRGHLHRAGVSYNARHMVSPEQVALWDYQPRIRRKISTGMRKKAVKPETRGQHTCPVCLECFDSKTGISNHVRGHLKRIGTKVTSSSKSPLCALNELLQNKTEHWNNLLTKSQFSSQPLAPQKFICSNGLFLMQKSIPGKLQHVKRSLHPIKKSLVCKHMVDNLSERKKLHGEAERGTTATSSTLVELLKAKQESVELAVSQEAYATRMICEMTNDYMAKTEMTSREPNWKKKPRLRPELKNNNLPSLNTEMCTLTCRFCDLVFHGPFSIQEDWIRHLQRHLLHTSVPHSGRGMVEVLALHQKIQLSIRTFLLAMLL
uniref:Zinc finger protein 644b n=1 Tax=Pundamilia nyererei TaxID=303518 RepID=A0A3B4GY59_9CICH